MALIPSQLAILKTDINSKLSTVLTNGKNIGENIQETNFNTIADYYNTDASPVHSIWMSDIDPKDLVSGLVMSEFITLTAIKQNGWFAMIGGGIVDATLPAVRANFGSIFSGAGQAVTLANLTALAQRSATNFEKLFSSVSGTANNSSLYQYKISFSDIEKSLAS